MAADPIIHGISLPAALWVVGSEEANRLATVARVEGTARERATFRSDVLKDMMSVWYNLVDYSKL